MPMHYGQSVKPGRRGPMPDISTGHHTPKTTYLATFGWFFYVYYTGTNNERRENRCI